MAVIKKVQKGTATIAAGSATGTASITAVTTANSFLTFTVRVATGANHAEGYGFIRGRFSSATQLTFTRVNSTGTPAASIEWCVTEYSSGVTVQSGSTTMTGATTNVTITAVTLNKTWPVATYSVPDSGFGISSESVTSAAITTTTNLQFVIVTFEAEVIWDWFVVQYDNCTTALYTHSKTSSGTSNQTITSVTTTKALIFATFSWDEDPMNADDIPRMYLSSATNVAVTTVGWQAGTYTIKIYTVNITDAIAVQRGDTSVASGNTSVTPTITSVTTDNSIVHVTSPLMMTNSTSSYTTDSRLDYNAFTASISSATQVTLTRASSGYAATCAWEVIDWTGILAVTSRTWVVWIPSI